MGAHQLPIINNEDLFEDAVCDLFNALNGKSTFKRFGQKGHNQKGIDIFSGDFDLAIQCKKKDNSRRDIRVKKELLDDIQSDCEKVIKKGLKIKINKLLFVSTFKDHPDIDEYCEVISEEFNTQFEIAFWGWNTLENKFLDYPELLKKYWPNFAHNSSNNEDQISRNLQLKKRISSDFGEWLYFSAANRKRNSRMLLRSVDSDQYPDSNEPDQYGEFSWFKSEIHHLYHRGMEFIIGIDLIDVFEDHTWDITNERATSTKRTVKTFKIGRINFSDIIDYDLEGDEFNYHPHIYCKFRHKGQPFESIYYVDIDREYDFYEVDNRRKNL